MRLRSIGMSIAGKRVAGERVCRPRKVRRQQRGRGLLVSMGRCGLDEGELWRGCHGEDIKVGVDGIHLLFPAAPVPDRNGDVLFREPRI